MSQFDRIVLSTNEDSTYFEFWPHVCRAWKKLYGVKVSLAIVTNRPDTDPWVQDMAKHGDDVLTFPEIQNIPTANVAQVVRHIMASSYGDEVVMVNDIDLLPLQIEWYLDRLEKRGEGQLLALGAEVYNGTPDEGKFPMGYATAEGRTWAEIVNPKQLRYRDLIRSWIGVKVFDHKEDISRIVLGNQAFADESLARVWLNNWGHPDRIVHATWDFKPRVDSIDRSAWEIDPVKLGQGHYIEAHMLRPLSKHRKQIQPLFDYVNNL